MFTTCHVFGARCRSIIEALGGRFWATANPDHGATFHFVLPAMR